MTEAAWNTVSGTVLAQGDFLENCLVPIIPENYGPSAEFVMDLTVRNLVIVTQTCDLANLKAVDVALCPYYRAREYELKPGNRKSQLEQIRKGRVEGLHMLPSPTDANNNDDARIVDFRLIVSLPFAYLTWHANALANRWRLRSPYLEHFSQAFAKFFMRVGLPSTIPEFKQSANPDSVDLVTGP